MNIFEPFPERAQERLRLLINAAGRPEELSIASWQRQAEAAAGALRALGIGPGARVGCVLTNSAPVCAAIFGIWYAGARLHSLPTISRGMSPQRYGALLSRLCAQAQIELLLVEEPFLQALRDLLGESRSVRMASFESLAQGAPISPEPPDPEEIVFVQYSSGSTRDPRGCMLSARAIGAHMELLGAELAIDPACDRGVFWLPLSHDMGLFGCLMCAWLFGIPLLMGDPLRFLRSPGSWLRDIEQFEATMTVGPSFALALASRAAAAGGVRARRLSLRRIILGGERVSWQTLSEARELFGAAGVPFAAFSPAYGLAEATLAVTMSGAQEEPHAIASPTPGGAPIVSCGAPLRGVSVTVGREEELTRLAGEGVGEIEVASPGLAAGYLGERELSAKRFAAGRLRTGDIGLVRDGEVFVVGRTDDMIPVAGRNIYATDFEQEVGPEIGVKAGSVVLLGIEQGERSGLVILAEPVDASVRHGDVAANLRERARRILGVQVDECLIVAQRSIPKTPSGKIQRFRARELLAAGELPVLGGASGAPLRHLQARPDSSDQPAAQDAHAQG
jgi:fatty-acyl-CoA synthase